MMINLAEATTTVEAKYSPPHLESQWSLGESSSLQLFREYCSGMSKSKALG